MKRKVVDKSNVEASTNIIYASIDNFLLTETAHTRVSAVYIHLGTRKGTQIT